MKRISLLLFLLALATGCALRPDIAGTRWKSVSLKWTERGGDCCKPEDQRWASIFDEDTVERLRRAFPSQPLQYHHVSGGRWDHEILIETGKGEWFRVFFWDLYTHQSEQPWLTILDTPREIPYEVRGSSADEFAEEVWLAFRSRKKIDLSFAELFSHPSPSLPKEILARMDERQKRLDGMLASFPAASRPHPDKERVANILRNDLPAWTANERTEFLPPAATESLPDAKVDVHAPKSRSTGTR